MNSVKKSETTKIIWKDDKHGHQFQFDSQNETCVYVTVCGENDTAGRCFSMTKERIEGLRDLLNDALDELAERELGSWKIPAEHKR